MKGNPPPVIQTQAQPLFEEGVTQILVLTEELKRSFETTTVVEWQAELDTIVERLDFLKRLVLDAPGDNIKLDLYNHVRSKTLSTAVDVLKHVSTMDVPEQAAVARIVELALILHNNMSVAPNISNNNNTTETDEQDDYSNQVIELYTNYQRFVLRNRAKPALAYLAQWRQSDETARHAAATSQDDDDDDDDDDETNTHIARPHSHAIATILGQASALVHPLLLWKQGLPSEATDWIRLCNDSVEILDQQAQSLTRTVSDWFWTDLKVDEWLSQVAALEDSSLSTITSTSMDLVELDALVDEMAFTSQLLARYVTLLSDASTSCRIIPNELLPEWTWKYASLERFLGRQQWKFALELASPVSIVMGLDIHVPSIVEDAHYLSTRALERASCTCSQQALGTVAHSISHDIWSTDNDDELTTNGVYKALVVDQRGCWLSPPEEAGESKDAPTSNGGSTFASALLGALDEDLGTSKVVSPPTSSSTTRAPASGGILGSLVGDGSQERQMRLDMQLCQLNGIHSASVACTSLSTSFDDDQQQDGNSTTTTSMIQLAREELARYAHEYQQVLVNLISERIHEWCGSLQDTDFDETKPIHHLRHFFHSEAYDLTESSFATAEADERLERLLIRPLKESLLIENLTKCDTEVTFLLCKELSSLVARIVLLYLWRDKKFTVWGSLLLSKQVRSLQTHLSSLVEHENALHAAKLLEEWQRVAQAVTILQLEKPSDWTAYRDDSNVLTKDEVKQTMSLRIDFSSDAIATVCGVTDDKEETAMANGDKQPNS